MNNRILVRATLALALFSGSAPTSVWSGGPFD